MFQVRARQLHPDKQNQASPEEEEDKKEDSTTEFQLLQEVWNGFTEISNAKTIPSWISFLLP